MSNLNNIIPLPDLRDAEAQAAGWIMRLDDGDASSEDVAALHAWLAEGEQNRSAFERLAGLWGSLDILEQLKDYAAADDSVSLITRERRAFGAPSRRSIVAATAAAASIAVMATAGVAYWTLQAHPSAPRGAYQTAVGEQKAVKLADGSVIKLNTDSLVEIQFTAAARNVRLMRGEAFFNVAPDKDKPFSVYAGKGVVTAVGTAFSVGLRDDLVDVLVTEGRVALSSHDAEGSPPPDPRAAPSMNMITEVAAGQKAVLQDNVEHVEQIAPATIERKLSWRNGVLAFSGDPLAAVIADVSRYTDVTIEIEDEALRDFPVNGYFKVGETEALLDALAVMQGVKIERISPKYIRLSLRETSER